MVTHALNRRHLLLLAAASAAAAWLPRSAWSQPQFSSNPFTLGVASGSPTHDSLVLWTRLLPQGFFSAGLGNQAIPVRWEIAHDEQFTRVADEFRKEGFLSKAGALYKKILRLNPDDEHALLQAAEMSAGQGLFRQSDSRLGRSQDPSSAGSSPGLPRTPRGRS